MSSDDREPYGAETFAEGNWYHELLEDGLALSYRVRPNARERERRARGSSRTTRRGDARTMANAARRQGLTTRMTATQVEEVLYEGASKFQEVEVVRTVPFGSLLITDGLMQSSEADEYVYHESLVHPALAAHACPKRVFIGGGGEGATLREVLRHPCVEECVMVDIDGDVVNMCRQHTPFYSAGAYDDKRAKLVIGDAKAGLESEADESFDVIIMDLSDPLDGGPCYQLYTTEFYGMAKRKLAKGGILITQSGCASVRDAHHVFSPIHHTLKQVFPKVYGYTMCVPSFTSEWGFNLAVTDESTDLSGENADATLKERNLDMRFYDSISHTRMFALPKPLRTLIDAEKRVMNIENPLFMCSTETHAGIFEEGAGDA